ncbi:MAG: HAD family hydrolase [Desulfovibrio sp.]|nr:MAG: HAD family hydrolase [Desulfovibrio sp.]
MSSPAGPGASAPALPKAIIFDLDGVLIDSWDATMFFYEQARNSLGLGALTPEEQAVAFTSPVAEAVEQLFPREKRVQAMQALCSVTEQEVRARIRPMPGAKECLALLKEMGVSLAVNTNGGREAVQTLREMDLLGFVDLVVSAEDVQRPKPDPQGLERILEQLGISRGHSVFIGDSVVDAATALAGGVRFWAFGNDQLIAEQHIPEFTSFMQSLKKLSTFDSRGER